MRGYRLFEDNTSVAIEWRIKGFRIRTFLALFVFVGAFLGAGLLLYSPWAGIPVILVTFTLAFAFATYTYRTDPHLVLSEGTMLRLILRGVRSRFSTNYSDQN